MNEWEWQLLEDKRAVDHLDLAGVEIRPGHRVRLRPREGADILDMALAGQSATIEAIEQDYEGKTHVCVVIDNDPGRDMGLLRQPGHRFFFDPSEIELLPGEEAAVEVVKPTILVAGIGNIFLGDDGFGVEVARRLLSRDLPKTVRVVDFGIRGFDLAYALQDGYESVILVDAYPQGAEAGTVYVAEPTLNASDIEGEDAMVDNHGMTPVRVLRLAAMMGARLERVLVVGCEPESLGGEEGHMGLSTPVEAAVDEAVRQVELLVDRISKGEWPGSLV